MEAIRARIKVSDFSWNADNMVDLVAPVDMSADPIAALTSPDTATATLYDDRADSFLTPLARPLAALAESGATVLSFERVDGWDAGDTFEVELDGQIVHRTTLGSVDSGATTVTLDDPLPGDAHPGQLGLMRGYVAGKTRLHVGRAPWTVGQAIVVRLADGSEEALTIASKGEERGSPYVVVSSGLSGAASDFARAARRLGNPVNLSGFNISAASTGTCDWGFRGVFPAGAHGLRPGQELRVEAAYTEGTLDYRGVARAMVKGAG